MVKLFVANPTRQDQEVHYRVNFKPPGQIGGDRPMYSKMKIPKGKQVALGGNDIPMQTAEDIIEQLGVFGMLAVVDIRGGVRPRGSVPLIWNIDREVPKPLIAELIVHNDGVKTFEGKERRRTAAVAANNALLQNLDAEMPTPAELVVDVEQDDQTENGEKRIEEGIRVSNVDTPEVVAQAEKHRAARNAKPNKGGVRKPAAARAKR